MGFSMNSISNLFTSITNMFRPIRETIDDVHTSGEEKLEHKERMKELELQLEHLEKSVTGHLLDLEGKKIVGEIELLKHQIEIAKADAVGHSYIQRIARPAGFLLILVWTLTYLSFNAAGCVKNPISDSTLEVFLLVIGSFLGVYGLSRGVEKIMAYRSKVPSIPIPPPVKRREK